MLSDIQEHFVQEYNFSLTLSNKFKALSLHTQDGQTKLYVLVDPSSPTHSAPFVVVKAEPYSNYVDLGKMRYVGSFKPRDGAPVHHLFDARPCDGPLELLAACGDGT